MSSEAYHDTVLVVEDEDIIRALSVEALSDAGYQVLEATNADEAVAILESANDIDVLFTDIRMPGTMDGLKLAEHVHGSWPKIRLLVTSGNLSPAEAKIPDASRFVSKPYTLDAVVDHIRELLLDR